MTTRFKLTIENPDCVLPARTDCPEKQPCVHRERNDFQGEVARLTGLEPATPGVTGRYSNQLSYNRPLPVHC